MKLNPGYVAACAQGAIIFLLLFDISWKPISLDRREEPPLAIVMLLWGGAMLGLKIEIPEEIKHLLKQAYSKD